jgi:hypothetical protein
MKRSLTIAVPAADKRFDEAYRAASLPPKQSGTRIPEPKKFAFAFDKIHDRRLSFIHALGFGWGSKVNIRIRGVVDSVPYIFGGI